MRTPSAQPRPWRRFPVSHLRGLGAATVTANTQVQYEIVPIFGASSLTARIKAATNGGTIDLFPLGPDFDPEQGATYATVTINPSGAENSIVYTSKIPGWRGAQLSVTYVDPGAASQALAVTVDGLAISVSLATNGSSAITSTAALVKTAIEAHADAGKLVAMSFGSDGGVGDGSGVVTAISKTYLVIAYSALVGTIYATGNPIQVAVTAGTEALITLTCRGEGYAVVKYTGTTGAGSITYCDVCSLPIAGR